MHSFSLVSYSNSEASEEASHSSEFRPQRDPVPNLPLPEDPAQMLQQLQATCGAYRMQNAQLQAEVQACTAEQAALQANAPSELAAVVELAQQVAPELQSQDSAEYLLAVLEAAGASLQTLQARAQTLEEQNRRLVHQLKVVDKARKG